MDLRRRILAKANNLFFISFIHDLKVVATQASATKTYFKS